MSLFPCSVFLFFLLNAVPLVNMYNTPIYATLTLDGYSNCVRFHSSIFPVFSPVCLPTGDHLELWEEVEEGTWKQAELRDHGSLGTGKTGKEEQGNKGTLGGNAFQFLPLFSVLSLLMFLVFSVP